jgi:hypothetical protein
MEFSGLEKITAKVFNDPELFEIPAAAWKDTRGALMLHGVWQVPTNTLLDPRWFSGQQ